MSYRCLPLVLFVLLAACSSGSSTSTEPASTEPKSNAPAAQEAPSEHASSDASAPPNDPAPAPPAPTKDGCSLEKCQTKLDCPAAWECFALDSASGERACFPTDLIFDGSKEDEPCLSHTERVHRKVSCTDHPIWACVLPSCAKAEEKPATLQNVACY